MKRLLKAAAALVCAFGFTFAHAQLTTIIASSISMGGVPIASGTVTFTPVNASGIPIAFTAGGGLNSPTAFSCTITTGAITGTCQIPDAALTTPANILYTVQITNTATQKTFTLQSVANITGTSWPLDHYGPPATTTNTQPIQVAYGTAAPPNSCVNPSFYVRNYSGGQLWSCVGGVFVQVTGGSSYTFANGLVNNGGTVTPTFGTTANTFAQGNDARIVGAVQAIPLPSGELADYKFLDGSGGTLTDSSGNGNNGTLGTSTASPVWTATGLNFSGNEIVNLPAALNGGKTFAMGICINPIPVNATALSQNQYPVLISSTMTGAQGLSLIYSMSFGASTGTMPGIYGPTILARGSHSTQSPYLFAGCHSYIVTLGTNGTSVDHIYVDGVELPYYALQGSSAGAQSSGNLIIGASSASDFFSSSAFNGSMYRLIVYPTQLAASSIPAVSASIVQDMKARGVSIPPVSSPEATPTLFAIGDSITNGVVGGGVTPWENSLSLVNQPSYTIVNAGIGGVSIAAIAGSEANRIAPRCVSASGSNVAIVFAGTNDFNYLVVTPSSTVSQTFAALTSEIGTLKKAGCIVFVGTMLSRGGTTPSGATWDADKNSYDALILAQAKLAGASGIVDFAADPTLGADGANATSSFQSDHIHPTQTSQNRMGVIASNSLNYYFGSTIANPTVVTSNTYQMLSGDRAITAAPTANAAYTLPDCTGPRGESYTISNPQSAFTLTIVGGASQPINGLTSAITIPANSTVTIHDVANPKTVSGCHWVM